MYPVRQTLHEGITRDELQELLDDGARVIWVDRVMHGKSLYDVILEVDGAAGDVSPDQWVMDFLLSVNPVELEKKMLENPDLEFGPGRAAVAALMDVVRPPDGT
jgi:hypothetical protein